MADQNHQKCSDLGKTVVLRFLGSLNPNLIPDFQNSKLRIQYGGPNLQKYSELEPIVHI